MDFVQKGRNYRDLRVLTDEQMARLSRDKPSRIQVEHDKRARREIANSNERRRMQSINSGFQRIKSLLPRCKEDKMSKSAILHQAVEYINRLEQEKQIISQQNEELLNMLQAFRSRSLSAPPTKRRKDGGDIVAADFVLPSPDSSDDYGRNDATQLQDIVVRLKEQLVEERQHREAAEKLADSQRSCLEMECLVEESVEEQIVTSPVTERSSLITLPMLVTEHESSLDHFVEIHDRSAVARRNLETIVKAIYHVEGSDNSLAEKMQESFGADGLEHQEQPERSLRFCIPSSLTRQPLTSVPEVGIRSLEPGARIPITLNAAVSILLSSQRSPGDAVIIQPVLTEKLS